MTDAITIDAGDLLKVARDMKLGPDVIQDAEIALADRITNFKDRLRGDGAAPGTVWPIGTVVRGGKFPRYVDPGEGARSGRSLRGWKARQKGINATVSNSARDPRSREFYANWAHLRGQDTGQGAEDAEKIFAEEMAFAAEDIATVIEKALNG